MTPNIIGKLDKKGMNFISPTPASAGELFLLPEMTNPF
jgi:hypothetical protein